MLSLPRACVRSLVRDIKSYKPKNVAKKKKKKKWDWSSEDRPIATAKLPRTGRGSFRPPNTPGITGHWSLSLAALTLELLKFDPAAVAPREYTG